MARCLYHKKQTANRFMKELKTDFTFNECPHVTKLAKYCQVAPKPCFGTLYAGYKT